MTTLFQFVPSTQQPFQFQPTLDGQVYDVTVTWNLAGQRYYINVTDLSSDLILCVALIGSETGTNTESVSWLNGTVTVETAEPHGYDVLQTINLTVSGVAPDEYNGVFQCFITGPSTFTYQLASNPGGSTQQGAVNFNINLVQGYFDTSTLVFRQASQNFEVTP